MTQSIFDRLRSMQTEGMPLHTLIVEACEVGNELVAALESVLATDPAGESSVWLHARRALARAYHDNSNGNGSNGSNRSAA